LPFSLYPILNASNEMILGKLMGRTWKKTLCLSAVSLDFIGPSSRKLIKLFLDCSPASCAKHVVVKEILTIID
jgi:hypothetical protein